MTSRPKRTVINFQPDSSARYRRIVWKAVGTRDMSATCHRNGVKPDMTGITLLELLITVAVVAILASIALPNYQDYVSRSRRADAMIALQRVANEQEQFYFDNNRYSTTLNSLGVSSTSPDGYYTISLPSPTGPTSALTAFTARGVPVGGSSQAGTGWFEILATGQKTWDPGQDGTFECDWDDANRGSDGC